MEDQIKLSVSQRIWLDQHGGRNKNDVKIDDNDLMYVFMSTGINKREKIYLPSQPVNK